MTAANKSRANNQLPPTNHDLEGANGSGRSRQINSSASNRTKTRKSGPPFPNAPPRTVYSWLLQIINGSPHRYAGFAAPSVPGSLGCFTNSSAHSGFPSSHSSSAHKSSLFGSDCDSESSHNSREYWAGFIATNRFFLHSFDSEARIRRGVRRVRCWARDH